MGDRLYKEASQPDRVIRGGAVDESTPPEDAPWRSETRVGFDFIIVPLLHVHIFAGGAAYHMHNHLL